MWEETKAHQMRKAKKGYLVWAHNSKGLRSHHFVLTEIEKKTEQWENFLLEKREGFRYALIGGCWHKKALG